MSSIAKASQPTQACSVCENLVRPFLFGMRLFALVVCLLLAQNGWTQTGGKTNNSLVANEDRLRLAQERHPIPSHGLYEDFRAQRSGKDLWIPDYGPEGQPIPSSGLKVIGVGTNEVPLGVTLKPEAGSSNLTVHVLARGLTESLVREALTNGHAYLANDSISDPTGFMFGSVNNQGVFTMGDTVTLFGKTRVMAVTPIAAKLRLLRDEVVVQEADGTNLTFETKEAGAYRVEARLLVGGEERPWIFSSPVYLRSPDLLELALLLPSSELSPEVERHPDITYREGDEGDAEKHKLDVYRLKGKTNVPVLFFVHGGAWKTGDRSQYPSLANRFVKDGYVTVVPSYRLAPKNPHPAQIEDVAAAFDWTVRHIAEQGGDPNRIYIAGHSAGGHLVALLALDERYLARYKRTPKSIRGVLALSGVYDLSVGDNLNGAFGKDEQGRRDASPLFFVKPNSPPFLVTYCEWDYFTLPAQAKTFYQALRKAGDQAELVYIPAQSHLSEMFHITSESDLTAAAALQFMK